MRDGWCSTCGAVLRVAYAAGREPRRMFCNNACRYAEPRDHRIVEVGDACMVLAVGCTGVTTHPERHGTLTRYRKGCRCDPCRRANLEDYRRGKARRVVRLEHDAKVVVHGASGYKNHGCRCDVCKAAKRAENAQRYQAT